jgi:hypothetical protein
MVGVGAGRAARVHLDRETIVKAVGRFKAVRSTTVLNNPVASVQTGTYDAFITGLHPLLQIGVALAYYTSSKHVPASYGANRFSLFQVDENEIGERVQLSLTPINGASGMAAPDKWEGVTTVPHLLCRHAYAGMGANDVGWWDLIVTAAPAVEMCSADFFELAGGIDVRLINSMLSLT